MAHTLPTPANLKTRYPEFTAVADATVQYWLTDAERFVDASWREADYAPALMAVAADSMAKGGLLPGEAGLALTGVSSFKSGTFSANISDAAQTQAAEGGWSATKYGREFKMLMRRNFGGPRLVQAPCL
ncbi:DUF4054 domain-containing protein [Sphingosinicella xenopeptidilytica]|uniref:DUF4054 domain-containing protein n=1 Tax=Sphingosinicella xenopeptidilytica TaxID=364098 RepID=A0ABW3C1K9_SPHXN